MFEYSYKKLFKVFMRTAMLNTCYDYEIIHLQKDPMFNIRMRISKENFESLFYI